MLLLVSTASSMEFKTLSTKPLRSWDCSSVSSVGLPKTFSLFLVCLQWETLKCSDNLSEWHGGTVIFLLALSAWRFFSYFCSVLGDCFWQNSAWDAEIWAIVSPLPLQGREPAVAKQGLFCFTRIYRTWGYSTKTLFCYQTLMPLNGQDHTGWG